MLEKNIEGKKGWRKIRCVWVGIAIFLKCYFHFISLPIENIYSFAYPSSIHTSSGWVFKTHPNFSWQTTHPHSWFKFKGHWLLDGLQVWARNPGLVDHRITFPWPKWSSLALSNRSRVHRGGRHSHCQTLGNRWVFRGSRNLQVGSCTGWNSCLPWGLSLLGLEFWKI